MNDEQRMLSDQIDGLEASLKKVRENINLFNEAKGLEKSIEKAKSEIIEKESILNETRQELSELKQSRADLVASTLADVCVLMNEVLPAGEAEFNITEDNKLEYGWLKDGHHRPYYALSGGEKIVFDAALAYALMRHSENKVIILEAAELDGSSLSVALDRLSSVDAQIIVNTCHKVEVLPDGWNVVEL